MATVTVTGDDITDVRLVAAKPSTLTGRVIVDPAAASLAAADAHDPGVPGEFRRYAGAAAAARAHG